MSQSLPLGPAKQHPQLKRDLIKTLERGQVPPIQNRQCRPVNRLMQLLPTLRGAPWQDRCPVSVPTVAGQQGVVQPKVNMV